MVNQQVLAGVLIVNRFLLVERQLDLLCRQPNLRAIGKSMNTLPEEIFDYYRQVFDRLRATNNQISLWQNKHSRISSPQEDH